MLIVIHFRADAKSFYYVINCQTNLPRMVKFKVEDKFKTNCKFETLMFFFCIAIPREIVQVSINVHKKKQYPLSTFPYGISVATILL